MALALRYAASSHVGLLRDLNEDAGYAGPLLLVVADGMGGHVAGEVASATAVAALTPLDRAGAAGTGSDVEADALLERLAGAIQQANDQLRAMMRADTSLDGMGTTLTAALRSGSRLGLAHIGDSRGYLLRGDRLQQITRDHTFVQSLVDEGRISAEQAEHHPQRALILRALDGRQEVDLDLSVRELQLGDRYLLCSDGLSGYVDVEALRSTLAKAEDPAETCAALVELALRAGGPDNITCVVADVVDDAPVGTAAPHGVGAAAQRQAEGAPAANTDVLEVQADAGDAPTAAPTRDDGAGARRAARPAYAGQPRPTGRRAAGSAWRLALVVVTVLLIAGVGYAGWAWSQQQYYVGADGDSVAIFRGVSSGVSGGALSSVLERQDMPMAALPAFTRDRVSDTIPARDLEHARSIVGRIQEQAAACATSAAAATPAAPVAPPTPATPSPASPAVATGSPAASLAATAPAAAPAGVNCQEVPL